MLTRGQFLKLGLGGYAMGSEPEPWVVDAFGRRHRLEDRSVFDALFPASLGVNPRLSIYGLSARNASRLAQARSGRPAPALA